MWCVIHSCLTYLDVAAHARGAGTLRSEHPPAAHFGAETRVQQLCLPGYSLKTQVLWALPKQFAFPEGKDETPASWDLVPMPCAGSIERSSVVPGGLRGEDWHVEANTDSRALNEILPRGKCSLPKSQPRSVTRRSRLEQT